MTALRQRMIEDMQLRGLSKHTRECYVRAVRKMAEYYAKSPDLLTEEQVRHYSTCIPSKGSGRRSTSCAPLESVSSP
jgi:integrase/recombinase XerD